MPTRNLVRIFHKRIAGVMAAQLEQHVGANRGMRLHNLEFLGREAPGLVEDRIVNRHLADIVQRRSQGDRGAFLIVEGDRAATLDQIAKQQLGQLFDVRNVPTALAVAKLHDAGHDVDEHATVLDALVVLLGQQVRQAALFGVQADGVAYAAAHDTGVKRAVDIVRGAQLVRAQNRIIGIFARNHDDRQIIDTRSARQIGQHLKAAYARHHNVQHHERQLIAIAVDHVERYTTVVGLEDAILVLEHLAENGSVHLGVIDNKHQRLFALEGLDGIGIGHDRTGFCLSAAQ